MQRQTTGLRFRDLPGFSRLFVDWIDEAPAVRDFLPTRPEIAALRERARDLQNVSFLRPDIHRLLRIQAERQGEGEPAIKNIDRLLLPHSVAILASITPAFAGGPLELLLKCLTAARLAAELENLGVPAVPLCWLNRDERHQRASTSVAVLDQESRPQKIEFPASAKGYDWLIQDSINESCSRIESCYGLSPGDAVLQEFRRAYAPGTPFSLASARFISSLVREWGIVLIDPQNCGIGALASNRLKRPTFSASVAAGLVEVRERLLRGAGYLPPPPSEDGTEIRLGGNVDPGEPDRPGSDSDIPVSGPVAFLMLEAALPVAGHVVGSGEIEGCAAIQSLFHHHGFLPPVLWPRISATIFDSRSHKILQKYGIGLADLLCDKTGVLQNLARSGSTQEVLSRFVQLDRLIDENMTQTVTTVASDSTVKGLAADARSRMLFQLGKLRERYEAAVAQRQEVIARHIERVSDALAPEGRLQETVIAGLHFILHNSNDFSRLLYDNLDFQVFEHQLISAE